MMRRSLQSEIPKARVNIQLDVDTGGGIQKKELPMKLLVVGDFSHGKTVGNINKRDRINIHKNNIDKVLGDLAPELNIIIPGKLNENNDEISVNLKFSSFKDFNPQSIANQIPQLKRLIGMRNLLKELKGTILDDVTLRKKLESIMNNEESKKNLQKELMAIAPVENLVEFSGEEND